MTRRAPKACWRQAYSTAAHLTISQVKDYLEAQDIPVLHKDEIDLDAIKFDEKGLCARHRAGPADRHGADARLHEPRIADP